MPPVKRLNPAEWLDLLIDRAPALRASGVLEVELDGCAVKLAPHVADEHGEEAGEGAWSPDPLKDPATFGGVLPGFDRLREREQ